MHSADVLAAILKTYMHYHQVRLKSEHASYSIFCGCILSSHSYNVHALISCEAWGLILSQNNHLTSYSVDASSKDSIRGTSESSLVSFVINPLYF